MNTIFLIFPEYICQSFLHLAFQGDYETRLFFLDLFTYFGTDEWQSGLYRTHV